jgi:hypothetical protein
MPDWSQINGLSAWMEVYRDQGRRELATRPTPDKSDLVAQRDRLQASLTAYATQTAIPARARTLVGSGTSALLVATGTGAGLLPGGKIAARWVGTPIFIKKSLNALGLLDRGAILKQLWKGAVDAGLVDTDPIKVLGTLDKRSKNALKKHVKSQAKALWDEAGMEDFIKQEVHQAFQDELMDEGVEEVFAAIPLIGQGYSAVRGGIKMNKTLQKIIKNVVKEAECVHKDLVFAVVYQLL